MTAAALTETPWYAASRWPRRIALFVAVALLAAGPELPFLMHGDPTRTRQWAEYLCYAVIAVGIDLVWGYGGMLALGQGVFFGLGAYAMGAHLSLEQVPDGTLPEFMRLYSDYESLPWIWQPFRHLGPTIALGVLVPTVVAALVGWLVFHRRIRGPYFALLTQASALVFWLLVVGQLKLTAGTNGLTNFQTVFGRGKYEHGTPRFLYYVAAAVLVAAVVIARQLVNSRYGRLLIAIRDGEDRVRFLGYDPAAAKTLAFAVSAALAGAAGMLAAPIIGLVAPNQFTVLPSILMVGWVAVGGRGTVYGALAGALIVSFLRTRVSESRPEDWQYFQGALFVLVVAFVPGGLAGLVRAVKLRARTVFGRASRRAETAVGEPVVEVGEPVGMDGRAAYPRTVAR